MILFLFSFITIIIGKIYYLTDIKYNIPYCDIDFENNGKIDHYHLNNILGTLEIKNDPLVQNLILNFYLSYNLIDNHTINLSLINITSCELCQINENYCNQSNQIKPGNLIFSNDIYYNFRIILKRSGYGDFISNVENITKYKLIDSKEYIYSSLTIPLETLLNHNNDSQSNINCNDKFEFILHIIVSTHNLTIRRDLILIPIEIIETIDNNLYISQDIYNLLCDPYEPLLSNFDCSLSNIYKVNTYKIENCLIPEKRISPLNYNLNQTNEFNEILKNLIGIYKDSEQCSIHDDLYYDSLLFNKKIKDKNILNLINNIKWCNETWKDILEKSIFDISYIKQCNQIFIDCDYSDDLIFFNYNQNSSIQLKPFFRLYKETIISLLNYLNCLSKNNNTRIIDIEKLIHRSIGIIKNSCYFKNGFELDYKNYHLIIYQLYNFNKYGYNNLCKKCNNDTISNQMKCKEDLFYCQFIHDSFLNSNDYIDEWYHIENTNLLSGKYNQIIDDNENNTDQSFGQNFNLFLEKSQYGIEAAILFTFILFISIFSLIMICCLCCQKCILIILTSK